MKARQRLVAGISGRWLTYALGALVLLMLTESRNLSTTSAWIPRTVLAVTLVLLVWQAVREARRPDRQASEETEGGRRALLPIAWIGVLLLLVWLLGPIPGCTLFCCAWLRWFAGETWRASLAIGLAVGLCLWLVFGVLAGVRMHSGLVLTWLT